ncbi:hypothetical protein LC55x_2714 [Lysobacter capsici]|nr:hypothetical protein LC55x_2714 [Lysobacter capsici]
MQTNQPNGALQCVGGCEHRFFVEPANPNGVVFSRGVSSGKACRPDNYTCPQGFRPGGQPGDFMVSRNCIPIIPDKCEPGQTLVNGVCKRTEQCPDGMVQNAAGACEPSKDECPAGQIKGPDGSCVNDNKCPAGQARGKDGSCKKDSDGDGNPDASEDDGKFSGGDSCKEPPQCSGDNILCGQARIQWRIDCNTRKNVSISGGGCNAEPICTGDKCDALEYAQLLQQWRASCALQKLAGTVSNGQVGTTPGSGTDPNGTVAGGGCDPGYTCSGGNPMLCASLKEQNQMRCAIEKRRAELAQAAGTGDGTDGTGSVIIGDQGTPSLNEGLVSYSGGVPNLSIDVGHGVQITPFGGQFAEYIEMIRFLIIALAMLTAISIIRGN